MQVRARSPSKAILSAWRRSTSIPCNCQSQRQFSSSTSDLQSESSKDLDSNSTTSSNQRRSPAEATPSESSSSSTPTSSKIYPYSRAKLRPSPHGRSPLFKSAIFTQPVSAFKPNAKPQSNSRSNFIPPPPSNLPPLPFHQDEQIHSSNSDPGTHLLYQALSPRTNHSSSSNPSIPFPPLEDLLISNQQLKQAYDSLEAAGRKGDLNACIYAASQVRLHLVNEIVESRTKQEEEEVARSKGKNKKKRKAKAKEGEEQSQGLATETAEVQAELVIGIDAGKQSLKGGESLETKIEALKLEDFGSLPISYLLPLYLTLLRLLGSSGQYEIALGVVVDMRRAGLSKLIGGDASLNASESLSSSHTSYPGSTSLEKLGSMTSDINTQHIRSAILDHLLLAFVKAGSHEGIDFVLNLISNPPSSHEHRQSTARESSTNDERIQSILNQNSTRNWTPETHSHMIEHSYLTHNLELGLSVMGSASSSNSSTSSQSSNTVPLTLTARRNLIALALHCKETRIAVEMADWFDRSSKQKVEARTWMEILRGAAEESDVSG